MGKSKKILLKEINEELQEFYSFQDDFDINNHKEIF